jgi:hypothetical protein
MSMNFLFLFFSSDKTVCIRVCVTGVFLHPRISSLSISFYYLHFILLLCIFSTIFFIHFGPLSYLHPAIHYKEPGAPSIALTSTIFGHSQLKLPQDKENNPSHLLIINLNSHLQPQSHQPLSHQPRHSPKLNVIKMHFSGLILASLATVAVAAPTSNVFDDVYNFDSSLEEFYSRVSTHIGRFTKGATSTCDVSKVSLPTSILPAAAGTLKYVAVGRGTQVSTRP